MIANQRRPSRSRQAIHNSIGQVSKPAAVPRLAPNAAANAAIREAWDAALRPPANSTRARTAKNTVKG